jgi:hypothetical protein
MKLSSLMAIKAVICIVFGIGFLLVPAPLFSLYGVTLTPGTSAIVQLFGAAFVLLSVMLWLARNAPGSEVALKAFVLAVFVGDTIGLVVALLAQLSGAMNSLGWMIVVLYLLLALGFGYFQFVKPAAESATPQTRTAPH